MASFPIVAAMTPPVFADSMLDPQPSRRAHPRIGWWLLGLVLLCAAPRAALAWRQDVICRDGVFYIRLAEALSARNWPRGFQTLGLNLYPAVLAALHDSGLDWHAAGKCWGVAASSLAVLPLFGWVRRLFNDRVALTAAVLYAGHAKLIEWSPELVRDPTFWLLGMTSIYCLVRAVNEVRFVWFLAAGGGVALAIHTRFEGWLLYVPWAWWTCRRLKHLVAKRAFLAGSSVAGVFAYPALLVLVNLTWLHDCREWQLGSFHRLQYVQWWWAEPTSARAGTGIELTRVSLARGAPGVQAPHAPIRHVGFRSNVIASANAGAVARWEFVRRYLDALQRGFGVTYGALAALGMWRWRHTWRRGDFQALLAVALVIFAAIWIHFAYAGATSSRYILPVLLLALPWSALGLLSVVSWCVRPSRAWLRAPQAWTAAVAICYLIGAGRGVTSHDDGLRREAAIGRWLRSEFGSNVTVALPTTMPVCAYYAGPTASVNWFDPRLADWPAVLADPRLALAVAGTDAIRVVDDDRLTSLLTSHHWQVVTPRELPSECRQGNILVWRRDEANPAAIGELRLQTRNVQVTR